MTEGVRLDLEAQHRPSSCSSSSQRASSTRRTSDASGLPFGTDRTTRSRARRCSGSQASRMPEVERLVDVPRRPGQERVGHRPVQDRVAVAAARGREAGHRSPAPPPRRPHHDRRPSSLFSDRCSPVQVEAVRRLRRRSRPDPTRGRRHRCARRTVSSTGVARAPWSGRRRAPATVVTPGLRREAAEARSVVRDRQPNADDGPRGPLGVLELGRRRAVTPRRTRSAPSARCRRGGGRA